MSVSWMVGLELLERSDMGVTMVTERLLKVCGAEMGRIEWRMTHSLGIWGGGGGLRLEAQTRLGVPAKVITDAQISQSDRQRDIVYVGMVQ